MPLAIVTDDFHDGVACQFKVRNGYELCRCGKKEAKAIWWKGNLDHIEEVWFLLRFPNNEVDITTGKVSRMNWNYGKKK